MKKSKWDVGIQAIGETFGEGEVENKEPFMAILFKDQPKGMDLKILGKGRIRKDLRGVPVQLLPGGFLQGVRDVDKLKEGF